MKIPKLALGYLALGLVVLSSCSGEVYYPESIITELRYNGKNPSAVGHSGRYVFWTTDNKMESFKTSFFKMRHVQQINDSNKLLIVSVEGVFAFDTTTKDLKKIFPNEKIDGDVWIDGAMARSGDLLALCAFHRGSRNHSLVIVNQSELTSHSVKMNRNTLNLSLTPKECVVSNVYFMNVYWRMAHINGVIDKTRTSIKDKDVFEVQKPLGDVICLFNEIPVYEGRLYHPGVLYWGDKDHIINETQKNINIIGHTDKYLFFLDEHKNVRRFDTDGNLTKGISLGDANLICIFDEAEYRYVVYIEQDNLIYVDTEGVCWESKLGTEPPVKIGEIDIKAIKALSYQ